MSESRVNQIGALLDAKNSVVRAEAARAFGKFSICDKTAIDVIYKHLSSSNWDARRAAAEAFACILDSVEKREIDAKEEDCISQEILTFNVHTVYVENDALAGADEIKYEDHEYTEEERRAELNRYLELDDIKAAGITAKNFISEKELNQIEVEEPSSSTETISNLKKPKTGIDPDLVKTEITEDDPERRALLYFVLRIISHLKSPDWNCRHGMALALKQIYGTHLSLIPPKLIDKCIVELLEVLILDRFADYASGRSSVVPVRETCAQVLGNILRYNRNLERKSLILQRVQDLLLFNQHWPCQQSALLVLKYYFSIVHQFSEIEDLFKLVSKTLRSHAHGGMDEVVSSAVYTLGSIVQNHALDQRAKLVEEIMTDMWKLYEMDGLLENSDNENLIMDLLRITGQWLEANESAILTSEQTVMITSLLDPLYQSRASQIANLIHESIKRRYQEKQKMEVLNGSSESIVDLNRDQIYKILKDLYRIFMFIPNGKESDIIMSQMVHYMSYVGQMYREKLQTCEPLARTLDKWIRCLELDHRNQRIDLIESNLEIPSERKRYENQLSHRIRNDEELEDFKKAFCSEEIDSLSDKDKEEVITNRKLLAAKFLAIPIHAFFEAESFMLDNQPMSESIQFLFMNKVQSSYSIYELVGTGILVNAWCAHIRELDSKRSLPVTRPLPLQKIVFEFIHQPPRSYAEVLSVVNIVTQESSDFVRTCTRLGVRSDQLPLANEGGDCSTHELAKRALDLAMELNLREKDRETVQSKYGSLISIVNVLQDKIKRNAQRIYAFLSSALFSLQFNTEKMTPVIRPLVDVLTKEDNINVTCEIYKYSIPILVMMTHTRNPRPHIKVLDRAITAFASCNIRIPKAEDWQGKSGNIYFLYALGLGDQQYHYSSQNAELMLQLFLTTIDPSIVPEFYQMIIVEESKDIQRNIVALELQNCFYPRYCPLLTEFSLKIILELLKSDNPALRFAGAKAVSTYTRSKMGVSLNHFYHPLVSMLGNLDDDNGRRGAVEVIALLVQNNLNRLVSLFAPLVFPRLADKDPEIRECAGEAFRKMVPLLSLEDSSRPIEELDEKIEVERFKNQDFIMMLSNPPGLPSIEKEQIRGLISSIALRHYQIEGITWLRFLRRYGLNGILADDMGLGKTLQTLCAIAMSHDLDSAPKMSLIVCPRTLVDHWLQEWAKFFPERNSAGNADYNPYGMEILVVSYEDLKSGRLGRQTWNYVVLDEGHVMRNPKSVIWKAANELRAHSRLILSGTPVQNSPADLWALFAWLMPGYLGDEKYFRQKYLKFVMKCRNPKASQEEIQKGQTTLQQLHKVILPFALRRLKSEVLQDLPPKMLQDYECYLTEDQQELYTFIMEKTSTRKQIEPDENLLTPLQTFQCLRRLVDHPFLLRDVLERIKAPPEILAKANRDASSGKLQALGHILQECGIIPQEKSPADIEESGLDEVPIIEIPHRALIFCQWKASVDLVTHALDNESLGARVSFLVLHGNVPPAMRQSIVDRFNSDHSIDVLVLTTNIGGVGLNLTGADIVIFVDHDFNPSKDVQAMDRAHRLGQTKKVHVYRLITKGTVEERVMGLQKFKQDTADVVIGTDNRLKEMNTEQLMETLSLEKNSTAAEPEKKRTKTAMSTGDTGDMWKLEELWDDSQYEDQFDVQKFMAGR